MTLMINVKIKTNWKYALWFMVILLLCISRASEIKQQNYSEKLNTKNFQQPTLMEENIKSMTNKQLKNACKNRGVDVKGKKETLQNRLLGLMKQDNDPKINILVEYSWSCIWFIILRYVGIRDIINHLVVTNQTIYHNIMKFKFDDSQQSMIKLFDLLPQIKYYLMWISSHKPYALELFLNLREYYTDISFLSALQRLFVNIYSIPSVDTFMLQIDALDNGYDFCVGIQTHNLILYDNDEKAITSIVPTPVNFTLFFFFIFQDVQILYDLGDIKCTCIDEGEIEYAIYFTKIIETEDLSIDLIKPVTILDQGRAVPCVVVSDCPESWNVAIEQSIIDDHYYPYYDDIKIITDGYILTKIYIPNNMLLQNME